MRNALFGAVVAACAGAMPLSSQPANAFTLPAPAALNDAAATLGAAEKVTYYYRGGYRGYYRGGYRGYYRGGYRGYYRPYYRSYYRPYRPYYRPYYRSYYRPYYRPYYRAYWGPRPYWGGGYGWRGYGGPYFGVGFRAW